MSNLQALAKYVDLELKVIDRLLRELKQSLAASARARLWELLPVVREESKDVN